MISIPIGRNIWRNRSIYVHMGGGGGDGGGEQRGAERKEGVDRVRICGYCSLLV